MAGDTLAKRRQDAAEFMTLIENMNVALSAAAVKASEIVASGVVYEDSDFEGPDAIGMLHLSPTILGDALQQCDYNHSGSVVQYMLANGIDVIFAKVRP